MIFNLCKELFTSKNLHEYLSGEMINDLYLAPKRINRDLVDKKLADTKYINKINSTINTYKNTDIESMITQRMNFFATDLSYKVDYKIYVLIGLDTTTIYSTQYNGEDVTVLMLESTNGSFENLDLLLAHEYTHLVRKAFSNQDIFETSIGERIIVEGIGCNYSREIVPNKDEYKYCIVGKEEFEWVENNIDKVEQYIQGKLRTNELMGDLFYMYADTKKTGMPTRTGYVYGYLIVKDYLKKNNLQIKDIINRNWDELIRGKINE